MTNEELVTVEKIGDIEVQANLAFVRVTVDDETVLMIPRHGSGLDVLAETLKKLST